MKQNEFIKKYSDASRKDFNPALFVRSSEEIIDELKNVILSCQRHSFFTIEVHSFRVIEDYEEIWETLKNWEEKYKSRNKNKSKDNKYDYINLKDSDIMILEVVYHIATKAEDDLVTVYIAVPRIVEKYYFRLAGNLYLAQLQVVDASTYNNSSSNAKVASVVAKTMFMPIRMYHKYTHLLTAEGETLQNVSYFDARIFNKTLKAFKYIFAKLGTAAGLQFLELPHITIDTKPIIHPDFYSFSSFNNTRNSKTPPEPDEIYYVSVPKYIFDNDVVTQTAVVTLLDSARADYDINSLFDPITSGRDFWKRSLGMEFHSDTPEKGDSILESLESTYDVRTQSDLHLPMEDKETIYHMIRWMVREFSHLRAKDNLDISTKKIRCSEYIAALYANKLAIGIYRIADIGKKATLNNIKKALITDPMYLLSAIPKCSLINFRNIVNDQDAMVALKFTYKGVSGLGENGNNSIPDIYRHIHPSHIGRVDLDAATATDPGISGTLCPYAKTYDGSFSEFQEPNDWRDVYKTVVEGYNKAKGIKEALIFRSELGEDTSEQLAIANDAIALANTVASAIDKADANGIVDETTHAVESADGEIIVTTF